MTLFVPVFPLPLVVYPGEMVNLHIFEEPYLELVNYCLEKDKEFAIPPIVNKQVGEFGTLVTISELKNTYANGAMDLSISGRAVIRVLEWLPTLPNKLYGGAVATMLDNHQNKGTPLVEVVVKLVNRLHQLLQSDYRTKKPWQECSSYDIAHYAGLSIEQEFELLQLLHEDQRLEFMRRHLKKVLPIVGEMEHLKEKIRQNGHFKYLKGGVL